MKQFIIATSLLVATSATVARGSNSLMAGGRNPTICAATFSTAKEAEISCHASGYHWQGSEGLGPTIFRCTCAIAEPAAFDSSVTAAY